MTNNPPKPDGFGKQCTNDDLMLALNTHWLAAAQHYTRNRATHSGCDQFICYYDVIAYNEPKNKHFFQPKDQANALWAILAIISDVTHTTTSTTIHAIIPTSTTRTVWSQEEKRQYEAQQHYQPYQPYQQQDRHPHEFELTPSTFITPSGSVGILPTIGSLCLLYHNAQGRYVAYLPLIPPQAAQKTARYGRPRSGWCSTFCFDSRIFCHEPIHDRPHSKCCNATTSGIP